MPQSVVGPFAPVQGQINRFFPPDIHPYCILEREILANLTVEPALLHIGCGRSAPALSKLTAYVRDFLGIDKVKFSLRKPALHLLKQDVCSAEAVAPEPGRHPAAHHHRRWEQQRLAGPTVEA